MARSVRGWYDPRRVGPDDWRGWAGGCLLEIWRAYLEVTEAAHEPGRDKTLHLYDELKTSAAAAAAV